MEAWRKELYNELYHHGQPGMHWGVRKYQYKDGSLTPAGRQRYLKNNNSDSNRLGEGRTKHVTGNGKGVQKHGEGLGTGPVGRTEGYNHSLPGGGGGASEEVENWEKDFYEEVEKMIDNGADLDVLDLTDADFQDFRVTLAEFAGLDPDKISSSEAERMRKKVASHYAKEAMREAVSQQNKMNSKKPATEQERKLFNAQTKANHEKINRANAILAQDSVDKKTEDKRKKEFAHSSERILQMEPWRKELYQSMFSDELFHEGVKKKSGRYPWGSGKNPFHHTGNKLRNEGKLTEKKEKEGVVSSSKHTSSEKETVKKTADGDVEKTKVVKEKTVTKTSGDDKEEVTKTKTEAKTDSSSKKEDTESKTETKPETDSKEETKVENKSKSDAKASDLINQRTLSAASNAAKSMSTLAKNSANAERERMKANMDLSNMSDNELRNYITRYNLEKTYKDIATRDVKTGRDKVAEVMSFAGDALAVGASAASLLSAIKGSR